MKTNTTYTIEGWLPAERSTSGRGYWSNLSHEMATEREAQKLLAEFRANGHSGKFRIVKLRREAVAEQKFEG